MTAHDMLMHVRELFENCIRLSPEASLKEMVPPDALVMGTLIIVGFIFGCKPLAGVLIGALVSGVCGAISAAKDINKICIGSSSRNVLWLQNDGSLYIAGRNLHKSYRELFYEAPMLMEEWTQRSLKCIDATESHFHCMVVCDDDSVWSLGRGIYDELGHGRHPKLFPELFAKITTLQRYRITSISAGNYFSLFICDDGNVWSCWHSLFVVFLWAHIIVGM